MKLFAVLVLGILLTSCGKDNNNNGGFAGQPFPQQNQFGQPGFGQPGFGQPGQFGQNGQFCGNLTVDPQSGRHIIRTDNGQGYYVYGNTQAAQISLQSVDQYRQTRGCVISQGGLVRGNEIYADSINFQAPQGFGNFQNIGQQFGFPYGYRGYVTRVQGQGHLLQMRDPNTGRILYIYLQDQSIISSLPQYLPGAQGRHVVFLGQNPISQAQQANSFVFYANQLRWN